jgi:hypothetical protein
MYCIYYRQNHSLDHKRFSAAESSQARHRGEEVLCPIASRGRRRILDNNMPDITSSVLSYQLLGEAEASASDEFGLRILFDEQAARIASATSS